MSWLAAMAEAVLRGIRQVVADMRAAGATEPEPIALRQYSGKFMVRIPPEVHCKLAIEAAEAGVSLNRPAGAKLSGG